jgi:hypothetical protein
MYTSQYGGLNPTQTSGLMQLVNFINLDVFIFDPRWAAYMLATVKHECADTWQPIYERGARTYFNKYEPPSDIAKRLGNTERGDGYLYRGRGYVQLTGRSNYTKMSRILGLGTQMADNPDLALQPATAYLILSHGMRNGTFTGKKLGDFIHPDSCDYRNCRKIINGLDCCDKIQAYAEEIEAMLLASRGPEAGPVT